MAKFTPAKVKNLTTEELVAKNRAVLVLRADFDVTNHANYSEIRNEIAECLDKIRDYGVIVDAEIHWPPVKPHVEDATHLQYGDAEDQDDL